MAHAGDGRLVEDAAARAYRRAELDLDVFLRDSGDLLEGGLALVLDLIFERAGRRRKFDREADAPAVDLQVLDHFARHQVATQLRLLDRAERADDQILAEIIVF